MKKVMNHKLGDLEQDEFDLQGGIKIVSKE